MVRFKNTYGTTIFTRNAVNYDTIFKKEKFRLNLHKIFFNTPKFTRFGESHDQPTEKKEDMTAG